LPHLTTITNEKLKEGLLSKIAQRLVNSKKDTKIYRIPKKNLIRQKGYS